MQKSSISYQDKLCILSDTYAHTVYRLSKKLPKEEVFGITSQLRRSSLSVTLNIIEGFARNSRKSYKQFLLISLGSLKESSYILDFCVKEKFFTSEDVDAPLKQAEEIGKMVWGILRKP